MEVTVFSRPGCKFCTKAKALLAERHVVVRLVDIGLEPDRRSEASEKSGSLTVPQIFVGQRFVGGFDTLESLDQAGDLQAALTPKDCDGAPIPPTPPELFAGRTVLPEAATAALQARAQELEALTIQFGPAAPQTQRAFDLFEVTNEPAQSQADNVPLNSAAAPGAPLPQPALPAATAQELAVLLRTSMLQLLGDFYDAAKGEVDYVRIQSSREWGVFRAIAAELGQPHLRPNLQAMPENERKAFLINLYNAMTFHGTLQYGRRSSSWCMYCFYIGPAVSYSLAGAFVSVDDVEHGMLRARPEYFQTPDKEFQKSMKMAAVDPRIHMALNCGAKSCPAIAVYNGPQIDSELEDAVAAFIADNGNVCVSKTDQGKVSLKVSEIFKMYLADFAGLGDKPAEGEAHMAAVKWMANYARGERKELLESVTSLSDLQEGLQFLPYDWETNGPDVPLDERVYAWVADLMVLATHYFFFHVFFFLVG